MPSAFVILLFSLKVVHFLSLFPFLFFEAGSLVYTGWLRTYYVALAGLELAIGLLPQLPGYVGWRPEPPQLAPILWKLSVNE